MFAYTLWSIPKKFSRDNIILIIAINPSRDPSLGSFTFTKRRNGVALRTGALTLAAYAEVLNNGTLGRGWADGVGRGEGRPPGVGLGECDDEDDASADGVTVDGATTAEVEEAHLPLGLMKLTPPLMVSR